MVMDPLSPPRGEALRRQPHRPLSTTTIVGTIATVLLVGLTAFLLYVDGALIVVIFTTQTGMLFPIAVAYVAGVTLLPWWFGRKMRWGGVSWLRTIAVCTAVILGLSLLFASFSLGLFLM